MTFHMDYESMRQTASVLDTGAQDITTSLGLLLGKVEDLLGEDFRTDLASGRFGDGYRELTSGIDEAVEGVGNMATALRDIAEKTHEHDLKLAGDE